MKTKIAFLAIALTFVLIRTFGQSVPEEYSPGIRTISNASPPTYETTTSGLDIKVWVMTQEEHKKMMEEMNSQANTGNNDEMMKKKDMSMNKEGKKSYSGTHHIKVEVTDVENGQPRNDLNAKVQIISPSKKSSWIDLMNMSNHYGHDLTLNEKGAYMFTIKVDDKGTPRTTQFDYTVQ